MADADTDGPRRVCPTDYIHGLCHHVSKKQLSLRYPEDTAVLLVVSLLLSLLGRRHSTRHAAPKTVGI